MSIMSMLDESNTNLMTYDLACEEYREYDFDGRVYRIDNPVSLSYRPGGTTHRIVDSEGVVHCVPVPGSMGCVLRWKNKEGLDPVRF